MYFHHSSYKSGLKVTDCTVQSAEYWCSYGTDTWSKKHFWSIEINLRMQLLPLSLSIHKHYLFNYFCLQFRKGTIIILKKVGETGVSWHMGFVGTLRFSLSANNDFTKKYHLYKGTKNMHTPYRFQSCSTNTVGINQLCLIFHLLSKFFSFQKS